MRFSTTHHPLYCGIDRHARTMDVCLLSQDGEVGLHRTMHAAPEPFLTAGAPARDGLRGAVAGLFPWSWLADLWAHAGLPWVLGHAWSLQALHGGKAQNETIDSQNMALLLRGGLLPQASGSPAEMRATRALRRHRVPLRRTRAKLLAPVQQTNRQDNVPEMGQQLPDKTQRDGVAARFPEPAVQQSVAVDLALMDCEDPFRNDGAWPSVRTAQQHAAQTLSRLHSVPGLGQMLRLGRRYERQDITRVPQGQDGVSSCRVGTCAKESAGTRDGTSGTQIGKASRTWACSEAAGRWLRHKPAGQH
jgi:hypothetical protein